MSGHEAVREAYHLYYRRLVAAVYGLTGNHAEAQDIVQETFARALARHRQFLDVASPEAWLRTVALNLARSRWRRRKLFDTLVRAGRVERTPESVPGISADRVALVAALQRLPHATREALVLHHLADLPVAEVAKLTRTAVGTVKSRLSRGRVALAELFAEQREPAVARQPDDDVASPASLASKETRHV